MRRIRPGLDANIGLDFSTIQTGSSGLFAFSTPAPYSQSKFVSRPGMRPQGVARIVMVALIVLGPYISLIFPVQVAAANNAPAVAPAEVLPAPIMVSSPSAANPIAAPTMLRGNGVCTTTDAGPANPLRGLRGNIVVGSQLSVNVGVRYASDNVAVVTHTNAVGTYFFDASRPVPADVELIVSFAPVINDPQAQPLTTYYNYFDVASGRYSAETATRIILNPPNHPTAPCQVFAFGDQRVITVNDTKEDNGDGRWKIAVNSVTSNLVDGPALTGRGLGGRIFLDDGTDNPKPFFNPGSISARVHTYTNAVAPNFLTKGDVDREGYYTLAETNSGIIRSNTSVSYALLFNSNEGQYLSNFYCNSVYTGTLATDPVNISKIVPINFKPAPTQNQNVFLTDYTQGGAVTPDKFDLITDDEPGKPPCTRASGSITDTMAVKGFHSVLRSKKQLTGSVQYDVGNGSFDMGGAQAVAIQVSTGAVAGTSNITPGTGDDAGKYTIDNLAPGTGYYVKIIAPTDKVDGFNLIDSYAKKNTNGMFLDVPLGAGNIYTTPANTSGAVSAGVTKVILQPGWSFKGKVTALDGTTPVGGQVRVYPSSAVGSQNPQPVTFATIDGTGNYKTDTVLLPGQSYIVSFLPSGGGYLGAWCSGSVSVLTSGNCDVGETSSDALIFPISSAQRPNPPGEIIANIKLPQGATIAGRISGVLPGSGNLVNLGAKATAVDVYVYKVANGGTPITPVLVQNFTVTGTNTTAEYDYVTAALLTGKSYAVRFVSRNELPNDPGFLPGYRSASNPNGAATISDAEVIVLDSNKTGKNIALLRASGINVTLTNNLDQNFSDVRVEVYPFSQVVTRGVTPPLAIATTNSQGKVFIGGIPASPGSNAYKIFFAPVGRSSFSSYKGTAACGGPPTSVGLTADVVQNIQCKMPTFYSARGTIEDTANPTKNWGGNTLKAYRADRSLYGEYTTTNPGFLLNQSGPGNKWAWEVEIEEGSYYFQMEATTDAANYLPQWFTGNPTKNGIDPGQAQLRTINTGNAAEATDFYFEKGSVLATKVLIDLDSSPLAGAQVNYFKDCTPTACTTQIQQVSADGNGQAYSRPTIEPALSSQAIPPGGSPASPKNGDPKFGLFPNAKIVSETLRLASSTTISGFVLYRNLAGVESGMSPYRVAAVSLTNPPTILVSVTNQADGSYLLKAPAGPFKLQFSSLDATNPISETRYWVSTPQQTGTLDPGSAPSIQTQVGRTYRNYNIIYEASQPQGCRITDAYVLSTEPDKATIRYFTNCPGSTRLGYSESANNYDTLNINNYPSTTVESETGGVATHTVTLSGLIAGKNYWVRPFSKMPASTTPAEFIPGPVELLVRPNGAGNEWFFPMGDTTVTPGVVSTTEVLHLFNYQATTANVTINYYLTTGDIVQTIQRNLDVPGNSRIDVSVHDANNPLALPAASRGLHSIKVTTGANQSIMVEKTQSRVGRLSPGGNPYSGSYTVQGANTASTSWWLPYVTTFPHTEQVVSVFNPHPTNKACFTVSYNRQNNLPATDLSISKPSNGPVIIPPNGTVSFSLNDAAMGPGVANQNYALQVSARLRPDLGCNVGDQATPIVVQQETRYSEPTLRYSYRGLAGQIGATGQTQRWFFLDGQSDKAYEVKYEIQNTVNVTATISLTVLVDNPTSGIGLSKQVTFTVAPLRRISYTVPFSDFNKIAPGQRFGFTTQLDANVPVVAQRSVKYLYSSSPAMDGLYQQNGLLRGSEQWLFAAGDTNSDLTSQIFSEEALNVYNPNPVETTLKITYYYAIPDSGSPVPPKTEYTSYTLAAFTRASIQPGATARPAGPNYPSVGPNKVVAVKIESSGGGIFAERLVYFRKGNLNGGNAIYGWNPSGS